MGRVSDAKERLMEAVLELIWTGSYGSTTIDQICEKAGVKKGSFYYFFDSKAELAETQQPGSEHGIEDCAWNEFVMFAKQAQIVICAMHDQFMAG